MENMNSSMQQIRGQYTIQIEQVLDSAEKSKASVAQKVHSKSTQLLKYKKIIPTMELKNKQLEDINKSMQEDMKDANMLAGKYATEISKNVLTKSSSMQTSSNKSSPFISSAKIKYRPSTTPLTRMSLSRTPLLMNSYWSVSRKTQAKQPKPKIWLANIMNF